MITPKLTKPNIHVAMLLYMYLNKLVDNVKKRLYRFPRYMKSKLNIDKLNDDTSYL